jgi:hypothetical protein
MQKYNTNNILNFNNLVVLNNNSKPLSYNKYFKNYNNIKQIRNCMQNI